MKKLWNKRTKVSFCQSFVKALGVLKEHLTQQELPLNVRSKATSSVSVALLFHNKTYFFLILSNLFSSINY